MRDAGNATAGNEAHALTGLELFVRVLRYGAQVAILQAHRDFEAFFLRDVALDRGTRDAARDRADDRAARGAAASAAHRRSAQSADGTAGDRSQLAARAFYRDLAHGFDHRHAHGLFVARFAGRVDAA